MMATLLLPAGITSLASIYYKDEADLLDSAENADLVYIEKVLPDKMYYNLKAIEKFSLIADISVMFKTAFAMLGKNYVDKEHSAEEKKEEVVINEPTLKPDNNEVKPIRKSPKKTV
jgi:lipopolysaccharide/colanic/teichoic acid biosynthesis glycosyltransferase